MTQNIVRAYGNNSHIYNHDDLYDKTIHHLITLPVWERKGIFTSNNMPGWQ